MKTSREVAHELLYPRTCLQAEHNDWCDAMTKVIEARDAEWKAKCDALEADNKLAATSIGLLQDSNERLQRLKDELEERLFKLRA